MKLNEELEIRFPEGFRVMDETETAKLNILGKGEGIRLSDPDRHMILSIGWKQNNPLEGWMLDTRDLCNKMEKSLRQAMEPFRYELAERIETRIGDEQAEGIRYTYLAEQVEMTGESLVIKHGKTRYYLHCYARTAQWAESARVWEDIIGSVRWESL